jgi:pantothenate kinase
MLVDRVLALATNGRRVIIGIAGSPGSGKSTLAEVLTSSINERRPGLVPFAAHVPMDGFHLADAELERLGRRDRKGAPDTFDAWGYVSMLRRLVARDEPVVYAPLFDRRDDQPRAGAIPVPAETAVVVTEGNYLLLDSPPWSSLPALLTEIWFCCLPEEVRLTRLTDRHRRFGKTAQAAKAWATGPDQRNAALIEPTAVRADLLLADGRIVSDPEVHHERTR